MMHEGTVVAVFHLLQYAVTGACVGSLTLLLCWILHDYFLEVTTVNGNGTMQGIKERWDIFSFIFNIISWFNGKFLSVIFWPFNLLASLLPQQKCEPILDRILLYNASQLAEKIRRKELKCVDVINSYIARIQSVNPLLNAVLEDRFKNAVEEAIAADRLIESEELTTAELKKYKPLLGVPLTVKENVATQGMPNNSGSLKLSLIRDRATEDAEPVRLAREAGAIVIAVSSSPELGMNIETTNKIIGTTKNPYNLNRTPGGSSGGEAALISSAGSLVGIGSDIGGSLRIPAHFTGIFSHKPSSYAVSIRGHFPSSADPKWEKYLVIGPMARYAEDLALMMEVIIQKEAVEKLKLYKDVPFNDIKLYYMTDNNGNFITNRPNASVKAAIENVVHYFKTTRSIDVVKADIKLLGHSVKAGTFPLIAIENIDSVVDKPGDSIWKELFRYITCRSKICVYTLTLELLMTVLKGTNLLKRKCAESDSILSALIEDFQVLLKDNGVLLYPVFPETAFPHNQVITRVFDYTYSSIFNTLGLPVTTCPIGKDHNGLPIAIQIIANHNNDRLTLSVARELEIAFGGWHPPPYSTA